MEPFPCNTEVTCGPGFVSIVFSECILDDPSFDLLKSLAHGGAFGH